MKKIITLLLVMCSLSVIAQEYTPLVREGVKWECVSEQIGWGDEKKVPYKIYFDGDSVKGDLTYKKCYIETESSKKIVALMREDVNSKKVYIRYGTFPADIRYNTPIIDGLGGVDADAEYLLYDFSEIGNSDAIKMASEESGGYLAGAQIVKSTMLVGDKKCNRSQVLDSDKKPLYSIVEGLGFIPEFSTTVSIGVAQNLYEGTMLDFLFYDSDTDGWTNFSYFNRLVSDDGTVLYESPNAYTPLVREGVKWECALKVIDYKEDGGYEESIYPYSIELNGSTKIDSLYYTNCYYVFEDENIATSDIPRAFLREDVAERKVYARFNPDYHYNGIEEPQFVGMDHSGNGEVLLYDFANMTNPEQSWNLYFENATVETYRLELGGKRLVKHDLDCLQFIESIGFAGSDFGDNPYGDLLAPMEQYMPCICDMSYSMFYRFIDNGTVVYENPLTKIDGVEKDADTAVETARYDIYGRRLSRPVQGINIIKMSDGTTRKVFTK